MKDLQSCHHIVVHSSNIHPSSTTNSGESGDSFLFLRGAAASDVRSFVSMHTVVILLRLSCSTANARITSF
jgi:hypothetical protein